MYGVEIGDIVGFYMLMVFEVIFIFYGCFKVGVIVVFIFFGFGVDVIVICFVDFECLVFFIVDGFYCCGFEV